MFPLLCTASFCIEFLLRADVYLGLHPRHRFCRPLHRYHHHPGLHPLILITMTIIRIIRNHGIAWPKLWRVTLRLLWIHSLCWWDSTWGRWPISVWDLLDSRDFWKTSLSGSIWQNRLSRFVLLDDLDACFVILLANSAHLHESSFPLSVSTLLTCSFNPSLYEMDCMDCCFGRCLTTMSAATRSTLDHRGPLIWIVQNQENLGARRQEFLHEEIRIFWHYSCVNRPF